MKAPDYFFHKKKEASQMSKRLLRNKLSKLREILNFIGGYLVHHKLIILWPLFQQPLGVLM
jgi:hypothetical protein